MNSMEEQRYSWKLLASLIICLLLLFTSKAATATEANAGICNGAWAIAGGYYCGMNGGVGGGTVLCVFLGVDADRNGVFRSGTSDQCIVNRAGVNSPMDCNEMCRLNNNCSNIQCPSATQLDVIAKRLNN
ncbi:hypothetical protein [Pseudomonas sp. PB3P13]